jgi:hypothetical protein
MSHHDKTLEAIAAIRMAIDNDDAVRRLATSSVAEDADFQPASDQGEANVESVSSRHWTLGAPDKLAHLPQLAELFKFPTFEASIKRLLSTLSPEDFTDLGPHFIKVCINTFSSCCGSLAEFGPLRFDLINLSTSNTSLSKTGPRHVTSFIATLNFTGRPTTTLQ